MVPALRRRIAFFHFVHVRRTRAVAIFTTDGQLFKRGLQESAVAAGNWPRHPAVTTDAGRKNRAIEAVVAEFVSGR